jgi:hypothetical protein
MHSRSRQGFDPARAKIKTFRTEAAFESWMRKNHADASDVWLRIYKKDSGVPSITIAEAYAPMRAALDEEFRADLRMAISEVIGVDAAIRPPRLIARVDCNPLARFGSTSVLFGA